MHTDIYIPTSNAYVHRYINSHAYIHTYRHIHTYINRTYLHPRTYKHTYTYIRIYIHIIYTNTHIHTYIHTYITHSNRCSSHHTIVRQREIPGNYYRGKFLEGYFASKQLYVIIGEIAKTNLKAAKFQAIQNYLSGIIRSLRIWKPGRYQKTTFAQSITLKFDVIVANNKAQIYNFMGTPYALKGKQHAELHKTGSS